MAAYVNSAKIQVFPYSQNRYNYQKNSRVLNEQNLTNLIKKLAGEDSCVLSRTSNTGATGTSSWEIILGGYLFMFECEDQKPLYAYIKVQDHQLDGGDTPTIDTPKGDTPEKDSLEENSDFEFDGLTLTASQSDTTNSTYSLQLLDADGKVPESSWFRFNSHSISMDDSSSLERRLSWQAAPLKNNS